MEDAGEMQRLGEEMKDWCRSGECGMRKESKKHFTVIDSREWERGKRERGLSIATVTKSGRWAKRWKAANTHTYTHTRSR